MGDFIWESQSKDLAWLRPDGVEMTPQDWQKSWISALAMVLGGDAIPMTDERGERLLDDGLLILMNAHHEPIAFKLPAEAEGGPWLLELDTGDLGKAAGTPCADAYEVAARSLVAAAPAAGSDGGARGGGRPGACGQEGGAAAAAPRRDLLLPLFSIRSATDGGIGDIPDIARLAPWANRAGFSVLQILPVNHAQPADPSPYSAQSAFALDPVYLSLDACEDFAAAGGRDALPGEVRQRIAAAAAAPRVDWPAVRAVKDAGIAVAFERFLRDEWGKQSGRAKQLSAFMRENRDWLDDYTLFTVLHRQTSKGWLDWPRGAREREPGTLAALRREHANELLREAWLQWQLDRQWRKARRDASAAGVELMGDLPFVVGLDSADVWANRALFRLDERLGTPPDEGSPEGQDWGLPVYDWDAMERDDFSWIRRRAKRAGELYGLYRVDHAVGCYRTYSARPTGGRAASRRPRPRTDPARRAPDADDEPLRRGDRGGPGRAAPLPAPVAGADRRRRLPGAALGARKRTDGLSRSRLVARASRWRPTPPTTPTPPRTGTTSCRSRMASGCGASRRWRGWIRPSRSGRPRATRCCARSTRRRRR